MLVLVHNILPPYRIPLFNAIAARVEGDFAVVLTRFTHRRRRRWSLARNDISFHVELLDTWGIEVGDRALDVSIGTGRRLSQLGASRVVVAGWDVAACWSALFWAKRRGVPTHAWVETSGSTGHFRGSLSTAVRSTFLRACDSALVGGDCASEFVKSHQPALPTAPLLNSVATGQLFNLPRNTAGNVLFVGELSHRKGADLVLGCAARLVERFGQLVIVGDGPLRNDAVRVSQTIPGVDYHGFVEGEDWLRAFRDARMVLIPSRQDPAPLVASEALAAARPIVVGPGVGIANDLRRLAPGAVGVMESSDAESLLQAIYEVDRSVVNESARRAFSPEACAEQFLAGLCIGLRTDAPAS